MTLTPGGTLFQQINTLSVLCAFAVKILRRFTQIIFRTELTPGGTLFQQINTLSVLCAFAVKILRR